MRVVVSNPLRQIGDWAVTDIKGWLMGLDGLVERAQHVLVVRHSVSVSVPTANKARHRLTVLKPLCQSVQRSWVMIRVVDVGCLGLLANHY